VPRPSFANFQLARHLPPSAASANGDFKAISERASILPLFEDGLSVDGDFNEIADDNPALVQRRVPAYAEIVAVYRSRGYETCAGFGTLIDAILPPRRLPLAQIGNAKFAGAAYAANGQIPLDRVIVIAEQFHFAAAKSDSGMMFNVEEIDAAQMRIAIRLARPQPAGFDFDFNYGGLRACGIEVEPTMDVFEVPADVGYHHVAYTEFRGRMSGFEEPLRQGSFLSSWILARPQLRPLPSIGIKGFVGDLRLSAGVD